MMKAGTETGSLVNHLYSRTKSPEPEVGMGATILCWTDRHPATIVKITRTQVHVQKDDAIRVDRNGMSESQDYIYTPNPLAPVQVFRQTKRGLRCGSSGLSIGFRDKYYDFSF